MGPCLWLLLPPHKITLDKMTATLPTYCRGKAVASQPVVEPPLWTAGCVLQLPDWDNQKENAQACARHYISSLLAGVYVGGSSGRLGARPVEFWCHRAAGSGLGAHKRHTRCLPDTGRPHDVPLCLAVKGMCVGTAVHGTGFTGWSVNAFDAFPCSAANQAGQARVCSRSALQRLI